MKWLGCRGARLIAVVKLTTDELKSKSALVGDTELGVRVGIIRKKSYRLRLIRNGTVEFPYQFPGYAAAGIGERQARSDFEGLVEVIDGSAIVPQRLVGHAAIVIGGGIIRVDLYDLV